MPLFSNWNSQTIFSKEQKLSFLKECYLSLNFITLLSLAKDYFRTQITLTFSNRSDSQFEAIVSWIAPISILEIQESISFTLKRFSQLFQLKSLSFRTSHSVTSKRMQFHLEVLRILIQMVLQLLSSKMWMLQIVLLTLLIHWFRQRNLPIED